MTVHRIFKASPSFFLSHTLGLARLEVFWRVGEWKYSKTLYRQTGYFTNRWNTQFYLVPVQCQAHNLHQLLLEFLTSFLSIINHIRACKVDMKLVPQCFSLHLPSYLSMLHWARQPMSKTNVYVVS